MGRQMAELSDTRPTSGSSSSGEENDSRTEGDARPTSGGLHGTPLSVDERDPKKVAVQLSRQRYVGSSFKGALRTAYQGESDGSVDSVRSSRKAKISAGPVVRFKAVDDSQPVVVPVSDIKQLEPGTYGSIQVCKSSDDFETSLFGSPYTEEEPITAIYEIGGDVSWNPEIGFTASGEDKRVFPIRACDVQERAVCSAHAKHAHGKVLVLGAGAGVFQQLAIQNPNVTSVVTVEENQDLAHIMKEQLSLKFTSFKEILEYEDKFQFIFINPWATYSYEIIPALNTLLFAAEKLLDPASTSAVTIWGHGRRVSLLQEAVLPIWARALANPELFVRTITEERLFHLDKKAPMAAGLFSLLRRSCLPSKKGKNVTCRVKSEQQMSRILTAYSSTVSASDPYAFVKRVTEIESNW